jgi:hypothetical protein
LKNVKEWGFLILFIMQNDII